MATYRLCRRFKYDLVIAKGPREIGMVAVFGAKLAKVPVIYHHSLDWFAFPPLGLKGPRKTAINFYRRIIALYRRILTIAVLKTANRVATVSDSFRDKMSGLSGIKKEDILLMANTFTLDDKFFNILPIRRDAKRQILYLGRIDANKNLQSLLKAVRVLLQKGFKDLSLVVVGDGPQLKNCLQLAGDLKILDAVRFLGYVPNDKIYQHLEDSLALVLPSFSEALPNAVLEAMASARPVVASKVGGLKELIDDGKNGFFIDPKDADDMAGKLGLLLSDNDLSRAMGLAGRERAKYYSQKSAIDNWITIMNALTDRTEKNDLQHSTHN